MREGLMMDDYPLSLIAVAQRAEGFSGQRPVVYRSDDGSVDRSTLGAFAERARTLVCLGRTGSLSTLSRKQPGFPFGSVMPYGLDERGRPIFLISTMAMHTQNLQADPRASLLVTQPDPSDDPLGASRVTLMGNVLPLPGSEVAETRKLYLARYANSKYWVDFEDFSFYRMDVVDVYYVGGFGVMGWVSASEYARAQPDPLLTQWPKSFST